MTTQFDDRFRAQAQRIKAYEGWLRSSAPGAMALRWLLGPGQWASNTAIYRLAEGLKLDAKTKLLDIGCERGAVLRLLDDQLRCEVPPVGIDFSRAMLEQARLDDPNPRREAGLVQGSGIAMPFRDATFNLVTCGYVLHDLDDDEVRALFFEVGRILEPGGLAVIWDFGPTGNRTLDAWNARVVATGGSTPRLRSNTTLRRLASDVGFPFTRYADLRPFLLPPIPRASIIVGRPPEGFDYSKL